MSRDPIAAMRRQQRWLLAFMALLFVALLGTVVVLARGVASSVDHSVDAYHACRLKGTAPDICLAGALRGARHTGSRADLCELVTAALAHVGLEPPRTRLWDPERAEVS